MTVESNPRTCHCSALNKESICPYAAISYNLLTIWEFKLLSGSWGALVHTLNYWKSMRRMLLMVTCSCLTFGPAVGAAQRAVSNVTRSPHGNLNVPCENCHTFTSWKPLRSILEFDHNKTRYPLRGLHQGVSCTQCHVSLVFSKASTRCADCHADIHRRQFGANCEQCHTVRGWQESLQALRTHENRFPLIGAHAALTCDDCHKGAGAGQFQGLSTDCIACHTQTRAEAKFPNHQSAGFPTTCQACHTMDSWLGANFDHAKFTGFALTGVHATLDCTACHLGGNFNVTSTACASCHLKDYTGAQNPNHVQAGFPQDCAICHNTANWTSTTFNHTTFTSFPLTGAHVNVACNQCHVNGRFAGTPRDCASCHLADYQKTTDPNHAAAGFPTDCSICHTTSSWQNAKFDHSATGFPLTGAHAQLSCVSCHVGGNFSLTSTTCVTCHLKDYNNTTNPNHQAAGIPQQCDVCHTTTAWTPASFNHNLTGWPLTGAHTTVPCASCHIGGQYSGTPTACYACHKSDYLSTTDPNHVAAAFPTDCSVCHTTSSWMGATFNHTWFPIYSGTHAGKWTTCADCHVNPSNYAVFSCITCHAHDKATMDAKHSDVRGYVYNSANCYSCHPTGQSGG